MYPVTWAQACAVPDALQSTQADNGSSNTTPAPLELTVTECHEVKSFDYKMGVNGMQNVLTPMFDSAVDSNLAIQENSYLQLRYNGTFGQFVDIGGSLGQTVWLRSAGWPATSDSFITADNDVILELSRRQLGCKRSTSPLTTRSAFSASKALRSFKTRA